MTRRTRRRAAARPGRDAADDVLVMHRRILAAVADDLAGRIRAARPARKPWGDVAAYVIDTRDEIERLFAAPGETAPPAAFRVGIIEREDLAALLATPHPQLAAGLSAPPTQSASVWCLVASRGVASLLVLAGLEADPQG